MSSASSTAVSADLHTADLVGHQGQVAGAVGAALSLGQVAVGSEEAAIGVDLVDDRGEGAIEVGGVELVVGDLGEHRRSG